MIYAAVAVLAATFIVARLVKDYSKPVWMAVLLWPLIAATWYKIIIWWAMFLNWTLWYIPATQIYPLVQVLDMALISVVIGLLGVVWGKWRNRTS